MKKPTRKPAKKYKSADDVFPSRKPKPPVAGTGCAENFRKPAKRPAAAPEVVYVTVNPKGQAVDASGTMAAAKVDRKFWNWIHSPCSIVKYRLDTRR